MKTCSKCGGSKALDAFRRDAKKSDGRESRCKACRALKPDTAPIHESAPTPPLPYRGDGLEVALIIPDCHHPNVDERAWSLLLRAAHIIKPKHIIILGDFADAECLSSHPATKPGGEDFSVEVESVNRALDQLDAVGAENKVYVAGNHEFRLDRYLMASAPAMFRSIQWRNVLELHRRGWQWVPYKKSYALGKLHITHDTGSAGANAHRTAAADFGGSAIIGHTHRMAYEVRGRFGGTPYLAAMLGWLGDAEAAADYMHEARAASSWAHGFGVAYLEPGTGIVHLQPVPIVNGRCVVAGRLVA